MALINRKTTSSQSTLPDEHQNSSTSPFIAKGTSLSPVTLSRRDNFPKGLRGGGGIIFDIICQCCGQCLLQNLCQICAGGNCPQWCAQCCSQCCPPSCQQGCAQCFSKCCPPNCQQGCPQWCPQCCSQCCPPSCQQGCPQWCPHWCQEHGQTCCRVICCGFSKTSEGQNIIQPEPSTILQNPVTAQPGATS